LTTLKAYTIESEELKDNRSWVNFVNSLSGFKSVNLLSTKSKKGQENLSIVSSAVHIGANPPLMGLLIRPHSSESPRHSLENIEETGFFTLNHVSESFFKEAHQTSARYPREVSEFEATGLHPEYKGDFFAPFVKESLLQISLSHKKTYLIEENQTHFVVGEINKVYTIEESLRKDGSLDIESLKTVALSGLDTYHVTKKLSRLSYAKPNKDIKEI
jgi:flavin reductase (DIM6/NTAB) family NADH-FMN oxidoreductase RutF